MPRIARIKSSTGYYHIMVRGVNRQLIFNSDSDCDFFVFLLKKYCKETEANIITYCLMSNHVHILMKSDAADVFIKKVSSAYVKYFNDKYKREGHLFQARFKSEPVEDDLYLLTVTRYILQNPQKAKIAAYDEYRWNNWREFRHPVFCDTRFVLDICGGLEAFEQFMKMESKDRCIDINCCKFMENDEAAEYICEKNGISEIKELQNFSKDKLAQIFKELKDDGFTAVQISQVTGMSRFVIQRMQKEELCRSYELEKRSS